MNASNCPSLKPRKRPAPSLRDQQIYAEYQIEGLRQTELAKKHGLTQCRISQIVRRVHAWRGQVDPRDEGEQTEREQQRLDRWLAHERLMFVCREAMCQYREQQKTVVTKKGHRGETAIDETTERTAPANVQLLKVVLQATRQLSQLNQLADQEPLPLEEPSARQREIAMLHDLCSRRQEAERAGKVTPIKDPRQAAEKLLAAFVGDQNDSDRDGPALREIAQALLPSCDRAPPVGQASSLPVEPAPTLNLEPETSNPSRRDASSTSPASPKTPQPQPAQPLPIQNQKSKIQNPATNDVHSRLLRHQEKLRELRAAQRSGLPYSIVFDPADGPLPPPPPYILDGYDP